MLRHIDSTDQGGTLLFECGSKHFYRLLLPDHNKKAAAKGPTNKKEQWLTELGIPEAAYRKACQSDKSLYFDLLPAERSVFKKLTWLGHQDGAKQGWWSLEISLTLAPYGKS